MSPDFFAALPRVDGGSLDAPSVEAVHLVLHERNERCNHDTQPLHGQCRHLEGDALATARRHEAQRVVSLGHTGYDVGLYAPEVGIAPVFVKNVPECLHGLMLRI